MQRPVGVAPRARTAAASTSMCPSASSGMVTTSAIDSRHGSSLLWCSNGPMNTTGRSAVRDLRARSRSARSRSAGMRRLRMPDQLVDRAGRARAGEDDDGVVAAAEASWMIARASSRSRVVCRPGAAALGVRVGVAGEHLAPDEVLEEVERAAATPCSRRRSRGAGRTGPCITWSSPMTPSRMRASSGGSGSDGSRAGTGSSCPDTRRAYARAAPHAPAVALRRATMAPWESRRSSSSGRSPRPSRHRTARGSRSSGTTRST